MPDHRSADRDSLWPLPTTRFKVSIPGDPEPAIFGDASGLESETQIITKRPSSADSGSAKIQMSGLGKVGSVILRNGSVSPDSPLWKWFDQGNLKSTRRTTVTIELTDDSDQPETRWTLGNAWPLLVSSYGVESEGHEVAVESIEIAYETLVIQAP